MNPNDSSVPATTAPAGKARLPLTPLLFCLVLMLVGCAYLGIAGWRYFHPPGPKADDHDLAAAATALVRQGQPEPLSEKLEAVLAEAENNHFPSYEHPLVGKTAPEFTRPDVDGKQWSLKAALANGPVVVVFYYGYHCNHCVSQLFGVKEDIRYFRELGAEVVALSADAADTTREKYKQYGAFPFPVLWDRGNRVAEAYGTFKPPEEGRAEQLEHGTFVIGQDGIVKWAAFGTTPFGDNKTLLHEIAKLRRQATAK